MVITIAAAIAMVLALGVPLPDVWQPIVACSALVAVSFWWQPNLLRGLAALVGFGAAFTLLMEAIASTANPLIDDRLMAADAVLGLSSPATVALVRQHPGWELCLKVAYFSVIPQTSIVILMLAESPRLWQFMRRFMLAALITVCCFYFWPAEGVATVATPPIAARFHALRSGADLSLQAAQGIITFPSFHSAWAVLLVVAFWTTPLRWPAVVLNAFMLASTVPVGGHYFVDVPAGILVAVVVIIACDRRTYPWPWQPAWLLRNPSKWAPRPALSAADKTTAATSGSL